MNEHTIYINDVDIREYGYFMNTGHSNPLLSEGSDRFVTIPGRPGQLFYSNDAGPIPFEIPLTTIQSNPIDLQSKVRLMKSIFLDDFGRKKTVKLVFGYETDKYYNVRYSGDVPIERIFSRIGQFTLPLICDDGYALSVVKSSDVTWGDETITFMNEIYTYGHSSASPQITGSGESFSVTVVGGAVRPVLTIIGIGDDVVIGWDGKSFGLGSVNGTVIVDLHEYVLMRDGVYALHTIKGDWLSMYLSPGDTNIEVTGNGLDLSINFDFRDRFF